VISLSHEYNYRNRSIERVRLENDKEIHNRSDCKLENELRDFDDLPMDDLNGSNDINKNIHQINEDLGF
jgi:hypothetical protein